MKVKIKSRKALIEEGWKSTREGFHYGDAKNKIMVLRSTWVQQLFGEKVDIRACRDTRRDGPEYEVIDKLGYSCWIPWAIIEGSVPGKKKIDSEILEKKFAVGTAKFYRRTKELQFDCSFRKMTLRQAKLVAKWIMGLK